ncbi:MAG: carbohydrate ABC transporter permease [Saccharofermentanales bacterium]
MKKPSSRLHHDNMTEKQKLLTFASSIAWKIFRLILLCGLGFLILNPIIFKFSTSIKSVVDLYDPTVFLIPKQPTFEYLKKIITFVNYVPTFYSTVIFTFVSVMLQLVACLLVSYGISRFKFPGRNLVFALVMTTLVIPSQTVLLPLYLQFRNFSFSTLFSMAATGKGIPLLNTYWPFIILSASALGLKNGLIIFILRQYFRNMPLVLEEAAYIDGCGIFKTFVRIMLPSAVPILVTSGLFLTVWVWNDNFYPSFFGSELNVFAVKFADIGTKIVISLGDQYNTLLASIYNNAAMFIHIIPVLIIYIVGQRYFVQGIERSGIVG